MSDIETHLETETFKGSSTLSKCRYSELVKRFNEACSDKEIIDKVLEILRDVMKFDPEVNMYEVVKSKLKDGDKTYSDSHKSYYQKNKVELNRKRSEYRKAAATVLAKSAAA
jgi:hypothetical protein